jgi:hypothetical protein
MKLNTLLFISALVAAASVQAQTPPADGSQQSPERQAARAAFVKACDADIKTLCADKQAGREVLMCLRASEDKVSAGCKDAMSAMRRPAPPAQ